MINEREFEKSRRYAIMAQDAISMARVLRKRLEYLQSQNKALKAETEPKKKEFDALRKKYAKVREPA